MTRYRAAVGQPLALLGIGLALFFLVHAHACLATICHKASTLHF